VIDGVTVNLMATSSSNVRIDVANDRSTLKTNIQSAVSAYNDLLSLLDEFTADEDPDIEMAGALSEDTSLVRFLKTKVKNAIFADSSTPSDSITSLRDLGLSLNKYGTVTFSETTYNEAVASNYDDIVTMLTADTSNENLFTVSNKGLAQDISTALEDLTDNDGIVSGRETVAKSDLTSHQAELTKLEARMDVVYNRYLTQFVAMETLMARLDNTKDYLTSQFETLAKAYDDP